MSDKINESNKEKIINYIITKSFDDMINSFINDFKNIKLNGYVIELYYYSERDAGVKKALETTYKEYYMFKLSQVEGLKTGTSIYEYFKKQLSSKLSDHIDDYYNDTQILKLFNNNDKIKPIIKELKIISTLKDTLHFESGWMVPIRNIFKKNINSVFEKTKENFINDTLYNKDGLPFTLESIYNKLKLIDKINYEELSAKETESLDKMLKDYCKKIIDELNIDINEFTPSKEEVKEDIKKLFKFGEIGEFDNISKKGEVLFHKPSKESKKSKKSTKSKYEYKYLKYKEKYLELKAIKESQNKLII